jgi:hypothetical protein
VASVLRAARLSSQHSLFRVTAAVDRRRCKPSSRPTWCCCTPTSVSACGRRRPRHALRVFRSGCWPTWSCRRSCAVCSNRTGGHEPGFCHGRGCEELLLRTSSPHSARSTGDQASALSGDTSEQRYINTNAAALAATEQLLRPPQLRAAAASVQLLRGGNSAAGPTSWW